MRNGQPFRFTERTNNLGQSVILPYLPITLSKGSKTVDVVALLDTGASVNVLPYEIGIQLGAVWENQTVSIPLSGNLSSSAARGVVLSGSVANFAPVDLAFAWTQSNDVPVILGHMNFFAEFNVCFYRQKLTFELSPIQTA